MQFFLGETLINIDVATSESEFKMSVLTLATENKGRNK